MCRLPNLFLLLILLTACRNTDGIIIPTSFDFKEISGVTGQGIFIASGFVGLESGQALYLGHRQNDRERVVRLNLKSLKLIENEFEKLDFVTKQLHILNDELWVIGGQYISKYLLDLSEEPISVPHGLTITRFGSAVYENELYVWGGDLGGQFSDRVYKWSEEEQVFRPLAALPGPKTWAHGEIVNERLYIFGGQEQFRDTPPNDLIYIYDIRDTTVAIRNLPEPMIRTFTGSHGSLIYVCGQVAGENGTGDFDIRFGVFNTLDFTYTPVASNLDDRLFGSVHALTAIGDRLFVVYGDPTLPAQDYSIMVANLP